MYFPIGQEWKYTNPSDEQKDDLYINNFKMVDLVTETIFQSSLSIWVLKSYGYEVVVLTSRCGSSIARACSKNWRLEFGSTRKWLENFWLEIARARKFWLVNTTIVG